MLDMMPFDAGMRDIDKFFGDIGKSFFGEWANNTLGFKTDILDKGDKFVLQAELPGFAKEDIRIDIDGDCLTVSAERKSESAQQQEGYIRRERSYGAFSRRFDISGVQAENIAARYNNGVLELDLPKRDAQLPSSRKIEIN